MQYIEFAWISIPANLHRCFHLSWLINPVLRVQLGQTMKGSGEAGLHVPIRVIRW